MKNLQAFQDFHHLGSAYLNSAALYFRPLAKQLIDQSSRSKRPVFLAINGAQGSGKSTLSDYLCAYLSEQGVSALVLSLDDFYLTRAERQTLAKTVHPLLATRGVPGTHDYELIENVLSSLRMNQSVAVPRFDKSQDDRKPELDVVEQLPSVVIFEGWCWGGKHVAPEALSPSVNSLEENEDSDLIWRHFVNDALAMRMEPLYQFMDYWVMLESPGFDAVYRWRLEQEQKLKRRLESEGALDQAGGVMSEAEISRFILHYQRVTEQVLNDLPSKADLVYQLDQNRKICGVKGADQYLVAGMLDSVQAIQGAQQ